MKSPKKVCMVCYDSMEGKVETLVTLEASSTKFPIRKQRGRDCLSQDYAKAEAMKNLLSDWD